MNSFYGSEKYYKNRYNTYLHNRRYAQMGKNPAHYNSKEPMSYEEFKTAHIRLTKKDKASPHPKKNVMKQIDQLERTISDQSARDLYKQIKEQKGAKFVKDHKISVKSIKSYSGDSTSSGMEKLYNDLSDMGIDDPKGLWDSPQKEEVDNSNDDEQFNQIMDEIFNYTE